MVNKVDQDRASMLAAIMGQLGIIFIVGAISGFIKDAIFEIVGQRVVCRVRTKLFHAIIAQVRSCCCLVNVCFVGSWFF